MRNVFNRLGLALALFLSACATTGTKIEESKLSQFQKGKTTYAEVMAALGPPQSSTRTSDGERVATYAYSRAQSKASSFIPVVGAFVGGSEGESQAVAFSFDKNDILTSYTTTNSTTDVNGGLVGGQKR